MKELYEGQRVTFRRTMKDAEVQHGIVIKPGPEASAVEREDGSKFCVPNTNIFRPRN